MQISSIDNTNQTIICNPGAKNSATDKLLAPVMHTTTVSGASKTYMYPNWHDLERIGACKLRGAQG